MSAGWQVLHAESVILTQAGKLRGAIVKGLDGKFTTHSVEGRLGAFDTAADAVAAITGKNLGEELAHARG